MSEEPVVIPGSLRPFVAAGLSAGGLGGLGGLALRGGGATVGAVVVLALAGLALAVLLVDLPLRTEADRDGLLRVCLLRRERIGWGRVVAVERQRRRITGPGTGGLVVRGRRGRWMITTSAEAPAVHTRLARVLAERAPEVHMRAEPPSTTTDPG